MVTIHPFLAIWIPLAILILLVGRKSAKRLHMPLSILLLYSLGLSAVISAMMMLLMVCAEGIGSVMSDPIVIDNEVPAEWQPVLELVRKTTIPNEARINMVERMMFTKTDNQLNTECQLPKLNLMQFTNLAGEYRCYAWRSDDSCQRADSRFADDVGLCTTVVSVRLDEDR